VQTVCANGKKGGLGRFRGLRRGALALEHEYKNRKYSLHCTLIFGVSGIALQRPNTCVKWSEYCNAKATSTAHDTHSQSVEVPYNALYAEFGLHEPFG
jgi:hypothetical protein